MSGEMTIHEGTQLPALHWSKEDLATIQDTQAPGLTPGQFAYYIAAAKHLGLDPLRKEIHPVVIEGRLVCQIGIDGYTKWAAQTGKFRGFTEPIVTIEDHGGELRDVLPRQYNPDKHTLISVTLGVRHADDDGDPELFTCHFREYVALKDGKPNKRWTKAPLSQLVKCCQALAIRRRFPGMGADVYIDSEVEQMQYSLTQEPPPRKAPKTKKALTAKQAVAKGIATVKALGAATGNIPDIGHAFIVGWNELKGTDFTSSDQLPDENAEEILQYWQSDEFQDELRQDSLLPMQR